MTRSWHYPSCRVLPPEFNDLSQQDRPGRSAPSHIIWPVTTFLDRPDKKHKILAKMRAVCFGGTRPVSYCPAVNSNRTASCDRAVNSDPAVINDRVEISAGTIIRSSTLGLILCSLLLFFVTLIRSLIDKEPRGVPYCWFFFAGGQPCTADDDLPVSNDINNSPT
jgi:hypothetical protein